MLSRPACLDFFFQNLAIFFRPTCRQRPGTTTGTMFLTLEDETELANIIVPRDTVKEYWVTACNSPYLKIEGVVGKDGDVIHLLARRIFSLIVSAAISPAHDFHSLCIDGS